MIDNIGEKVKRLRNQKNITLKELSEKTNLSVGFLSQFERGLTTIAIDSLGKIAQVLNINLSYFFNEEICCNEEKAINRSYENEVFQIDNSRIIHYFLSKGVKEKTLLPRLIEILPMKESEEISTYSHEGEEFIYVLEGILTLVLEDKEYDLYPEDSAHYFSKRPHNWTNKTNKKVKFLFINTPNLYKEDLK